MTKGKSQFSHPLPRCWLKPYLFALSEMFNKRWSYWYATILNGKPLNEPIPKINFWDTPHKDTKENILNCAKFMQSKGYTKDALISFVEWILWGFGASIQDKYPDKVTEEISRYWYKNFNLGLMIKYPCDYMAWASCEISKMSGNNNNGYFPTPGQVVKAMVEMQMDENCKTKTVCDPCGGTGIMLLYASNYSLRLFYTDISLDLCKMATLNAWLYIPWMALPFDINWTTQNDYQELIKNIDSWIAYIKNPPRMLPYQPKTNTLQDWI